LRLDAAGHIQSRRLPIGQRVISIRDLRGQWNNKEVARVAAFPDHDGGPDFAAARVRKRNGSRTTSPREQFIEDVVRLVIPHLAEATFGLREPGGALPIIRQSLYRNADMSVLRQCQWLEGTQHPVFIDGFDRGNHLRNLLSQRRSSNNRSALFRGAEAFAAARVKEGKRTMREGRRAIELL